MKSEIKVLIGLAAAVGLAFFGGSRLYNKDEKSATENVLPSAAGTPGPYGITLRQEFIREDSHTKGPKTAKVTVIEFLDPECEACRAFHPIMKQTLKDYEGGIHFVVRYMAFHTSSFVAIAATEAAGLQGKYWEMQDMLFNTADEWSHKPKPDTSYFIKYAGTLGLDVAKFTSDLSDPKWAEKASRDMADGKTLGVQGTPTIFINGDMLKKLDPTSLRNEIEKHLR